MDKEDLLYGTSILILFGSLVYCLFTRTKGLFMVAGISVLVVIVLMLLYKRKYRHK
jgi:uncharacterized membrane protein YccC